MTVADISMTYSSMEALAKEISNIQVDFDNMRTGFDSVVQSLEGQWQGAAQKEFTTAYSKLKPKLTTVSEVLSRYSTEITSTAKKQFALDTEGASTASTVSF